jgi:N-acetyl-gamma-glutamyl-phosphate reductase
LKGTTELVCEEFELESFCDRVDYVFTALPHKLPMAIVPDLLKKGKKVIDLSADFRFTDVNKYEAYYQPHSSPELLNDAVYGLSEIYYDEIKKTPLVGTPGCYPTSILLPLIPLVQNSLIEPDTIIADSKSGVSGAGRGLSLTTHFCEANESFKPYKIFSHRHKPEINEILSLQSKEAVDIVFTPHLLPLTRGMLSTIYVNVKEGVSEKTIRECLEESYKDHFFIRLHSKDSIPDIMNVKNTNFCDIGFYLEEKSRKLVIVSAIDNLLKGASGQAIQNMNIMAGFDETCGLI